MQPLESDPIFEHIANHVKANPEQAKQIGAVFQLKITKDGQQVKTWTLDLKLGDVYEGNPKNDTAIAVVTIPDDIFVQVSVHNLNPQQVFMQGKTEVTGNILWMHKLWIFIKSAAIAKL